MTLSEEKSLQRKAGIAARRALPDAARGAANAALCAHLAALSAFARAKTLLVYAAFGDEVNLAALIRQAEQAGKTVAYPICGDGFALTAAVPGSDGWEIGAYGIRTPIASRAHILRPEELDLVLVPCTAFDTSCRRVGMGKGYYDRYLPRCQNAVTIGVAFDCQRVEHAASGTLDAVLDAFATEKGVYCHGTDPTTL